MPNKSKEQGALQASRRYKTLHFYRQNKQRTLYAFYMFVQKLFTSPKTPHLFIDLVNIIQITVTSLECLRRLKKTVLRLLFTYLSSTSGRHYESYVV